MSSKENKRLWRQRILLSLLVVFATSSVLMYGKVLSTPNTILIELKQSINIEDDRRQLNLGQLPKGSSNVSTEVTEKCIKQLLSLYNGTKNNDEIKKFVNSQCKSSSQCIPETSKGISIITRKYLF